MESITLKIPETDVETSLTGSFLSSNQSTGLPPWAASLIGFGELMAERAKSTSDRKTTLVLCLPCIDFAAALVTFGVHIKKVGKPEEGGDNETARLKNMIGKWVSFVDYDDKPGIGRLESVPEVSPGEVKITRYKRMPPNFENMSPEERSRYHPPTAAYSGIYLSEKYWATVKPVGREFSLERGGRINRVKVAARNKTQEAFSKLLGYELDERILACSESAVHICGNASRITSEFNESLIPGEELRLAQVLRLPSNSEYDASAHCSINNRLDSMPPERNVCVILEAGRRLADQLASTQNVNRVVLLGRNSASYEECIQQVLDSCAKRKQYDPLQSVMCLAPIKNLIYHHL